MTALFRVALCGDGAVGKTSIRKRYMGTGFSTSHQMTVGADFAAKQVSVDFNGRKHEVTLQIWDLAGQKRFTDMRARFYQGAVAGLMVFDVTRPESFKNLTNWINELWKNNGNKNPVIPIVILGNKSDISDRSSIKESTVEQYCKQLSEKTKNYGFNVKYLPTSALTGQNIEDAFDHIAKLAIQTHM